MTLYDTTKPIVLQGDDMLHGVPVLMKSLVWLVYIRNIRLSSDQSKNIICLVSVRLGLKTTNSQHVYTL